MKNYTKIKRFGAAATAVAMLSTLGTCVFADEADSSDAVVDTPAAVSEEITDVDALPQLVQTIIDSDTDLLGGGDDDSAATGTGDTGDTTTSTDKNLFTTNTSLTFTEITAKKYLISETTDQYTYKVNVKYAFGEDIAAGKQIAMVGYTYDGEEASTAKDTAPEAAKIYAINQVNASKTGSFDIRLTSKDGASKEVSNEAKLIIKIGTDAYSDGATQACVLDLASAVEAKTFTATTAVASTTGISVPYGSTKEAVVAKLEDAEITATVKGANTGEEDTGYTVKDWALKAGETWDGTNLTGEWTFVGTVEAGEDSEITFPSEGLKVEVKVTLTALTAGDVTVTGKTVKVGDTYTAGAYELIDSITVKSGDITDTYAANSSAITYSWKDDTALDTSATGNTATLIVKIDGASAKGIFDLTGVQKEVTFTVVPAVKYGDVNADGAIDMKDVGLTLKAYLEKTTLTENQRLAADVNGDNEVNMKDVGAILKFYLEKIDKFDVEK